MNNFYSILKFNPNKATEDSIAIGVLLSISNKITTYFSENRIKVASKLIQKIDVNLPFIVKQIEKKAHLVSNENKQEFSSEMNFLNEHYFSYLNRYSNGLLGFSKPNKLHSNIYEDNYFQFVNYLFPDDLKLQEKPKKNSAFDKVKKKVQKNLINRIEQKVHTNQLFNPKNLNTIYFNLELDCIGLNGAFIGAKTVDFSKSIQSIDKEISHYFTLISSLSSKYKKPFDKNDFYLITEEPDFSDIKINNLWDSVDKNKLIEIIHPDESEKVAELIEFKKAQKFLF